MSATHSVNAQHRNHWMLPLALITAAIMLVGWFPASALWHQQAQLNATASEINSVGDRLPSDAVVCACRSIPPFFACTVTEVIVSIKATKNKD